ncbi:MAG: serine/threonine protein kinase [Proteobacteria bacterium]|nr:serine/threonine protein kinase [Pseudomonadota bacterium]
MLHHSDRTKQIRNVSTSSKTWNEAAAIVHEAARQGFDDPLLLRVDRPAEIRGDEVLDQFLGALDVTEPAGLAARVRQIYAGTDQIVEVAFHIAAYLPPLHRREFLDLIGINVEQREHVDMMLANGALSTPRILHRVRGAVPSVQNSDLNRDSVRWRIVEGMHLGHYQVEAYLGSGGMAAVYRARDTVLDRPVAIKVLDSSSDELFGRFMCEARNTARCRSENIVAIYDVGEHRGTHYLVLEYIEGRTLRQIITGNKTSKTRPLSAKRAVDLAWQIASALCCAHQHNIVHRDLKPENIVIDNSGTVKLLDFGISKAMEQWTGEVADETSPVSTEEGLLLGTLPYMSPEQWGIDTVDRRTDIWAVGVILYEMLTGEYPYSHRSWPDLGKTLRDVQTPMPRLGDRLPEVGQLDAIVDGCLQKRKQERTGSAKQLMAQLRRVAAQLGHVH